LLDGVEFEELVADIKVHGLIEPIILLDDQILDGRNRARACAAAGVKPIYRPFTGEDPGAFVISANIRRRHLNQKQRKELLIKIIARAPGKSDRQIAKSIGVDHKTIGAARAKGEQLGSIPQLKKTIGADSKARKRATTTPEQRIAVRAAKGTKGAERRKQQVAQAGIGVDSSGEIARKLARLEELEAEVARLRREKIALNSEIGELKAENTALKARLAPAAAVKPTTPVASTDPLEIPPFLDRCGVAS
jgi:ParB-like chromosome segregation protein Spo0J